PPGGRGGGRMMGPNADQLAKDLDLNDAEKAKVKTIIDDQQKKMTELRADTALSQTDRRAKMQTIREDTAAKMKEALPADKFEKFQQQQQQMRQRFQRGGGTNAPAPAAAPKQ